MAASRGYRLKCVMPESVSMERRILMLALGAEVYVTAKEDGLQVLAHSNPGFTYSAVSAVAFACNICLP